MGNAIALAAADRGSGGDAGDHGGPVEHPDVTVLAVETADEMAAAVWKTAGDVDVAVLAAAVADFRPADPSTGKLRRTDGPPEIVLGADPGHPRRGGPDATPALPRRFRRRDRLVRRERWPRRKRKGVDLLVGNDVSEPGSGFGTDTNQVAVITPDGSTDRWPLLDQT